MVPNHIVYSTETGKVNAPAPAAARSVSKDGIVRLKRETKGRKGKGVTLIEGLDQAPDALKITLKNLKQKCGCGGAIKDGVIEIQTHDRDKIKVLLEQAGFTCKIAGG